jgi:hypothetical protein
MTTDDAFEIVGSYCARKCKRWSVILLDSNQCPIAASKNRSFVPRPDGFDQGIRTSRIIQMAVHCRWNMDHGQASVAQMADSIETMPDQVPKGVQIGNALGILRI